MLFQKSAIISYTFLSYSALWANFSSILPPVFTINLRYLFVALLAGLQEIEEPENHDVFLNL